MAKRTAHKKTGPQAYKSAALAAIHRHGRFARSRRNWYQNHARNRPVRLTPVMTLTPDAIRRIRKKAAVSQAVFAAHLNVTTGVVSKWERGEKQPRGPAAKLLTLAALGTGIASIA